MKKFSKVLAAVLAFCMVATLCIVPMTASAEETYEDYDVIGYSNLRKGGAPLNVGGWDLPQGDCTLDYSATSSTHSAIVQFRATVKNASGKILQMHFSGWGANNNFSYQYNNGGFWQDKRYNEKTAAVGSFAVGKTYDIEMGRLKVKTGENAGKYYSYLKVNGVLRLEKYVLADEEYTTNYLNDKFYFHQETANSWNISEYQEPDYGIFEPYEIFGYSDLKKNGKPLDVGGQNLSGTDNQFDYSATSQTHSAIFKFRATNISDIQQPFQMHFSGWGGTNNFGYRLDNGYWKCFSGGDVSAYGVVSGDYYDIEMGRLKVKTGENAGKYYSYLKVDGVLRLEKYVSATEDNTTKYLKDIFYFHQEAANLWNISEYQEPPEETYEDYDVIEYYDLLRNGSSLGDEDNPKDATYTYDKTSSTYSAILKFRWKAITGTSAWFSFDTCKNSINYKFGMQFFVPSDGHDNGQVDLLIDGKNKIDLPFALVSGGNYDIEFARLKVKTGHNNNKGRYYIYLKINDTFIGSYYTDRGLVDTNGNYIDQGENCSLSNKIYVSYWNADGNRITAIPVPETLATDYDEIGVEDLDIGGNQNVRQYFNGTATYDQLSATKSVIFKFRWENRGNPSGWISFDKANNDICNLFGVQHNVTNKTVNIGIGYSGGEGTLPANIECGTADAPTCYDIEFSRIKVLTGPNKRKYYVSFKIDGVLIAEDYVAVNADGTYTSNGVSCALSNEIFFSCWGSGGAKDTICEIHDETPAAAVRENEQDPTKTSYGTYDEVVYCSVCGAELSRTKEVIDTSKLPLDMIIGTQTNKENETRLIMKLTDTADVIQSYKKVGFIVTVDGDKQSVELDGVYTGFYNIEQDGTLKEYAATDLDCTYVSILEIHDITKAETVTVQGFFIDDEGKTTLGAIRTLR